MGSYYAGIMGSDYSDELYHHGILGQKWGIRRYQNEDGTLTDAGKKRYSTSDAVRKYYSKNYQKTHNRAFDKINKYIPQLNEKYKDYDFTKDKAALNRYNKEARAMFKKIYIDEFNKDYGAMSDNAKMGREWLEKEIKNNLFWIEA